MSSTLLDAPLMRIRIAGGDGGYQDFITTVT